MVDREKVTMDATIESLDLKSIDIVMILTAIEDKFDVYIPMDGPFHDAKDVKSLIDAIALAQCAALVVGVDTGLTHVAAAYCRPTIELYIATPRWKTEGYWSPQIVNLGDTGVIPSVTAVCAAIDGLLGALPASPAVALSGNVDQRA